jgi:hypothetical protein
MAKYIFTAPYTIGTPELTSKQGVVTPATTIRVFKAGDIVEGKFNTNMGGMYNPNPAKWVEVKIDEQVYPIPFDLVKEYTGMESANNTSTNVPANKTQKASVFNPKNVIIGVLIIGSILGGLKLFKVI